MFSWKYAWLSRRLFLLPIFLLRANISELTVHWKKLAILSVLNSAAPFFLLTFATLSITGGFAGILNATAPIFAAMVAWVWLSDRLGVSQIVGLVIGFVGVLVLVWNKVTLDFDGTTVAILAGIIAAIFYGVGGNFTKKYMGQMNSLAIATGTMTAAAIILLPIAIYLWPSEPVSTRSWIAAIIMGVASTGIAYILYFRLIRNVGPVKAITVTFLIPAFAMLWGAIFIDEKVTSIMVVGCTIIFSWNSSRDRHAVVRAEESLMLPFIGALIGAAFGGFGGLIVGGLIGYAGSFVLRQVLVGTLQVAQTQLLDSTFSIMGALCKADNVVSRDEINAVEQIFGMLKLQDESRKQAKAAFNRGKQDGFDLDAAVDQFAKISRGRGPLVQLFLQLQCMAVAADGRIDPAEHAMLVRIAQRLGLTEADVSQLEALLRAAMGGPSATVLNRRKTDLRMPMPR